MSSENLPPLRSLLHPGAVVHLLPSVAHAAVVVDTVVGAASLEWLGAAPDGLDAGPVELRVGDPAGAAWRVAAHIEPSGGSCELSQIEVIGAIEDREFSRLKVTIDAEFAPAGPRAQHPGCGRSLAADISAGGVALAGADLEVGDVVLVRATVPLGADEFDLQARAEVSRIVRRDDGVPVCGLRWVDLDWETREHLSAAVVAGRSA